MSDYSDLEIAPETVLVRGLLEPDGEFVAAEQFRSAMRIFATGVVIVTTEDEDGVKGLTINSCCSISVKPPKVLISLAHTASLREPLLRRRRFGLSILGVEQLELAERGAVPGGPKAVDAFVERLSEDGPATIAGALAHLDCSVSTTFEVSDHTLVIGLVEEAVVGAGAPLIYFDRTFRSIGNPLEKGQQA